MKLARRSLAFLFLAAGLVAQPDVVQLLTRFAETVRRNVAQMPDCLCVENIERHYYRANLSQPARDCDALWGEKKRKGYQLELDVIDRVRLDVHTDGGQEIYSWPGAGSFGDREIWDLIGDGPAASGHFSTILQEVVQGDAQDFAFREETEIAGRKALRYTFRTPEDRSHNFISMGNRQVATAWDGVLWIDPATAKPARLTTRTSELPREFFACEISTAADYQDVDIAGRDMILPKEARQRFIVRTGQEVEGVVTFSACHKFQTASTVTFGAPGEGTVDTPAPVPPPPDLRLPEKLPVTVELTSRIDSTTAAAGDRFTGKLAWPVIDRQDRVVLAKGTPVTGRLRRVAVRMQPAEVAFVLHVETAQIDGRDVPIHLIGKEQPKKYDWLIDLLSNFNFGGGAGGASGGIGGFSIERHPAPSMGELGFLRFKGSSKILEPGYRTEWLTGSADASAVENQ